MEKREEVRWFLIVCSLILGIIAMVFYVYFYPGMNLKAYIPLPENLNSLDWGGIASLCATVTVLSVLRVHETIKNVVWNKYSGTNEENKEDHIWQVIMLLLALAGLIGVWLAIRVFGLFFVNYVTRTDSEYSISQIFSGLSFILAGNLCFTLMRTFERIGKGKKEQMVPELIEVAIQALVIGILAFLPRYGDEDLLLKIGGQETFRGSQVYVIIFMAMTISLTLLIYGRTKLATKNTGNR